MLEKVKGHFESTNGDCHLPPATVPYHTENQAQDVIIRLTELQRN